jgi:hypothetical protein
MFQVRLTFEAAGIGEGFEADFALQSPHISTSFDTVPKALWAFDLIFHDSIFHELTPSKLNYVFKRPSKWVE